MADQTGLGKARKALGLPSDGLSAQTRRALQEHGELAPQQTIPVSAPAAAPVVGGPSPSPELLERVRIQQEAAAKESLQRLLEARRQRSATVAAPAAMPLTTIPRR